jgi:competence ComEA-like helix-hairpin-helix protein
LDLTPSERRGALVLLALVALGTGWDLFHREAVPAPEPAPPSAVLIANPSAARPGETSPLELNSATEAELDRLPGIGPVLAARIVSHRREHGAFHATEDLLAVQGIGPRLFDRLRSRVTVSARGESLHFAR